MINFRLMTHYAGPVDPAVTDETTWMGQWRHNNRRRSETTIKLDTVVVVATVVILVAVVS